MSDTLARLFTLLVGRPDGLRRTLLRRLLARWVAEPTAPPPAASAPPPPTDVDLSGLVAVARLDELAGGMVEAMVGGEPVVLCRVGDGVHAVDATCPHAGGALADGDLDGPWLVCPLHGWRFDVRTGACQEDPDSPVRTWRVEVVGDVVHVGAAPVG